MGHTTKRSSLWEEHLLDTARSAFYLANGEYRGNSTK